MVNSMPHLPIIDIIIPAYNKEAAIGQYI